MNIEMDTLGDLLTTHPIHTGWECIMVLYPSGQSVFIDDPDRQFGNGSVWTLTRTRSDSPEPLLTLAKTQFHQSPTIFGLAYCILSVSVFFNNSQTM